MIHNKMMPEDTASESEPELEDESDITKFVNELDDEEFAKFTAAVDARRKSATEKSDLDINDMDEDYSDEA